MRACYSSGEVALQADTARHWGEFLGLPHWASSSVRCSDTFHTTSQGNNPRERLCPGPQAQMLWLSRLLPLSPRGTPSTHAVSSLPSACDPGGQRAQSCRGSECLQLHAARREEGRRGKAASPAGSPRALFQVSGRDPAARLWAPALNTGPLLIHARGGRLPITGRLASVPAHRGRAQAGRAQAGRAGTGSPRGQSRGATRTGGYVLNRPHRPGTYT